MSTNQQSAVVEKSDTVIRKFMFERSFDKGRGADFIEKPKPKPIYTQEQLDAARQEGHKEGFIEGQNATRAEQQAELNVLIQKIGQKMESVAGKLQERKGEHEKGVGDIALAIARKILPSFIEKQGAEEVHAILNNLLPDLSQEPRLVIHVAESQASFIEETIQPLAKNLAFSAQIVVLGDKNLSSTDCSIDWTDGGIERNLEKLWSEIDKTLAKFREAATSDSAFQTSQHQDAQTTQE